MLLLAAPGARAAQDVVNTRHNLSAVPPLGVTRTFSSSVVDKVCVFCHTPHNALPDAQLWNHAPTTEGGYILYGSTTLSSVPQQPTGKSRLCLACHDGTVALGALNNPPAGNDLGSTFLTGRGNLSTDLSDDHPISFPYDTTLLGLNPELADPAGIGLPLEGDQLQCTTCHDPHEKDLQPFLRTTTVNGVLCTTCHQRADNWATSTHATSTAAVTPADLDNRRPEWVAATVAGNSCLSCHTPHNAQPAPLATRAERLLAKGEEDTCYGCHDGSPASDIQAEFLKLESHPVADMAYAGRHDATRLEDPTNMPLHVECMDCHNPHTVVPNELPMISFNPNNVGAPHMTPPAANALISGVTGIDLNGSPVASVTYQYELCFKCHGRSGRGPCDGTVLTRCSTADGLSMTRSDGVYNIRDKVNSSNPGLISWHPIESNNSANNTEVPSLVTAFNASTSLMYCTDCHNSDQSAAAGGIGPNGPHGSANPLILAQRYSLNPTVAYSAFEYELCFRCHSEASILSDASFREHRLHIEQADKACINCHDPHGSHKFQHLLNFQITTTAGSATWTITDDCGGGAGSCGRPEPTWEDAGTFSGQCYLDCHERDNTRRVPHNPFTY